MAISAEAASFSSSTNSTIPPWKYHVFLSFRGEDTREGFTDHLHAALRQRGIITFIDDELRRGEVISKELLKAIEESLSSIVILSKNYASSTWCLDELLHILESRKYLGREVFPVFYNVYPSDVRHQKGTFADAFKNHSERFGEDKEKVQRWRDALEEVANISGYDSMGWHETKLIEEIVAEVWTKLQPKLPYYNNELVGIDPRMKEMNSLLRIGLGDVRLIGIWGMGGIGKTTLARIIYERICGQFDSSCFLADVREKSKAKGLVHLQRKLLSNLKLRSMEIDDTYEGMKTIRNLLCSKKILAVLDDVSEISQLENLSIKQAWLAPGSRVIVTTRNMNLLRAHGEFEMYKAELLNNNESLELFCKRAFKRDKPTKSYLKLSKSVIHHAKGLPLTLEVLGSYLCGRSELEWKVALEKIKNFPPSNILKRLRTSYEALDDMEKKIFLDIACFFKGMIKDQVTQIFEICGFYPTIGIRELVEKCLITEYYSDHSTWCLGMHDILQEMGRSIVFEESPSDAGRRSRLWSLDDIDHVMTKKKGSDLIEVIHLQSPMPYKANWDLEVFSTMCSLRILIISCDVYLPVGLKCLPSSLKILEWKSYPLKSLPRGAYLGEIVLLKMPHSKIIQLWGRTQMTEKLKFIDLSYSKDFITTPNFSMLPNLEQLVLEGCIKLVKVHPSLGQHKKLVVLDLKDCKNLKDLPSRLEMDSLKKFILSGCLKVKKLPEFGRNMNKLSVLDVKNCKSLVCLPSSICNLKSLRILNILGCSNFSSLPQNLDENKCLEELDVSGTAIREIPSSIIGLQNLKLLHLNGCKGSSLTSSSLWNLLSSIQRAFGFSILEAPTRLVLPRFISSLSSLRELIISNCNLSVGSIPNDLGCLPSLEVLDLGGNNFGNQPTGSWVLPPSFSNLSSLKILNLGNCNLSDGSIPDDLSCLSSLQRLSLLGNNFTHLPASCVSNLLLLCVLHLSHCPRLKVLPDLPLNLEQIDTVACYSLQPLSFPELLLKCIAFANDSQVSFPHRHSYNMQFVVWFILESEIPSWFHNQNFQYLNKIDGFRDNHVVRIFDKEISSQNFEDNENSGFVLADSIVSIKVDISHFCDSSERWGISLCLVLQDMELAKSKDLLLRNLWLTSKASQDEFFTKEIVWSIDLRGNPHQMLIMYLPCNNFTANCNQVEFIFYTQICKCARMEGEVDVKVDCQNRGKFIISNFGWRVTCKEDVEEWCSTMKIFSTSDNSEILSQGTIYANKCKVNEVVNGKRYREEDLIAVDVETETYYARRRKLK